MSKRLKKQLVKLCLKKGLDVSIMWDSTNAWNVDIYLGKNAKGEYTYIEIFQASSYIKYSDVLKASLEFIKSKNLDKYIRKAHKEDEEKEASLQEYITNKNSKDNLCQKD